MWGNCDSSREETDVIIQEDLHEIIPLILDEKFFGIKLKRAKFGWYSCFGEMQKLLAYYGRKYKCDIQFLVISAHLSRRFNISIMISIKMLARI